MGKILYFGTFGSDDPTRASLPFLGASGALARGHQPVIIVTGEAVLLMKDVVADAVHGIGFPPLRELMDKVVDHQVPIYVGVGCAAARGVADADLRSKNAQFATPDDFADLMMEADRVVSF
jgi:uncharacterized protein involved in oxidation of intracellular sulfur